MTHIQNVEQRIAALRCDRTHGSRWLAHEAASLLLDLATDTTLAPDETEQRLRGAAGELMAARPAMAAVGGTARRVLNARGGLTEMARAAALVLEGLEAAPRRVLTNARPLIRGTLMTHSMSGTVLDALVGCAPQIERVIVLEGRPGYEGREVARALAGQAISCTLITDAQADIFLPACQAVVVGADSVFADGSVLNKAGTALLAWAAYAQKVPMYVLAETLKITPVTWSGDMALLEEKDARQVLERPIAGIEVHNYYFDRTPGRLITKIISEEGLLGRREIRRLAGALNQPLVLSQG